MILRRNARSWNGRLWRKEDVFVLKCYMSLAYQNYEERHLKRSMPRRLMSAISSILGSRAKF
jgi:hypothetical protein